MKLSAPLRIGDVSALLGWSHERTRRWLLAEHARSGNLVAGGGKGFPYTVTLAALHRAFPDAFEPTAGLEARGREQDTRLLRTATEVGLLRRELRRSAA